MNRQEIRETIEARIDDRRHLLARADAEMRHIMGMKKIFLATILEARRELTAMSKEDVENGTPRDPKRD
jgi:hypothetical protein